MSTVPPLRKRDLSDVQWQRLAIRMLHKTCPDKAQHGAGRCPSCGIDSDDHRRFIVGGEGKR